MPSKCYLRSWSLLFSLFCLKLTLLLGLGLILARFSYFHCYFCSCLTESIGEPRKAENNLFQHIVIWLHSCTRASEITGHENRLSNQCLSPKGGFIKTNLMPLLLCYSSIHKKWCGSSFCSYLSTLIGRQPFLWSGLLDCWACSHSMHAEAWMGHGFNGKRWHFRKLLECISHWWLPAILTKSRTAKVIKVLIWASLLRVHRLTVQHRWLACQVAFAGMALSLWQCW